MTASQNLKVNWQTVPTRTITAGGVEFAYRELATNNPGTPVVFLIHLAAVLDNWDPRVVDGFAASRRVITFDNRGVGASSGAPATSIEQGPAGAEGISKVARVTHLDMVRGLLTHQDPKQFLFFTRTPGGIRAGKEFLAGDSPESVFKRAPSSASARVELSRALARCLAVSGFAA